MTFAAAFNGGKSQVNLNFIQTGGDYPFLNAMKSGQSWGWLDNTSAPVTPDILDSDGYPTSILHTGVYTVFYVPSQADRPGNYVITWDGNGTISCGMDNTLVSGSKTSAADSRRYVFSTADTRFVVGISAIGSPKITNIKVFHVDDETLINAGEVFGVKFKQRLVEGNIGVIRFLNWMRGNTTDITTWATRKPQTYAFYAGEEVRSALYAGTTTNVGNAYSVAAPSSWSGLVDKAAVHIVFNASATQSGTCSLNVGGTGAINVLNQYSGPLSTGTNSYPVAGTFVSMATLVYDAVLNAWIKRGGDLSSAGIDNGVPPELLMRLCAEVGAHPYFVAPKLACSPMTDWHTQLATYCRDNGPAWMVPRFEGPNELWNTAAGFTQTGYANSVANAYGWSPSDDYHNWYGRVISTIGQAVSAVYSANRTRYQVICGVQTSSSPSSSNARLASTKYILQTPQSGYTATAASSWVTHVCCAQYITPVDQSNGNMTAEVAAFAGKAFKASISTTTMSVTKIIATDCAPFAVGDTIFGNSLFQSSSGPVTNGTKISALPVAQTITAISRANPAVVTVTTPPADGTPVYIAGAATNGMTQLPNGWYVAKSPSGGTYQLQSVSGSNIDSSAFTAYSGSGATSRDAAAITVDKSQTVSSVYMTAATDLTQATTFCASVNNASGNYAVATVAAFYASWKTWAQGFSINKMCGYEGGYSPDYVSGDSTPTILLKSASKLDPNLALYTQMNYRNFVGLTDGTFTAEFPSCYKFSGNPSLNNRSGEAWSVLEDIYQTPSPPQWDAMRLFNTGKQRFIAST